MKKILILMLTLLTVMLTFLGCDSDYKVVSTIIVKGKVSAKEEGLTGRIARFPVIYVQDDKHTKRIEIPHANENDFTVGDDVTLVIQMVEKTK